MASLWEECSNKLAKIAINTSIQELNYAVNVSLKNKYIYVETPKVACSTIKLSLQRLELEDTEFIRNNFEDLHDRSYSPLLSLKQIPNFDKLLENKDLFRFCFVRDPYTRLLSAYLDKVKPSSSKQKSKILLELGISDKDSSTDISFEKFISVLEKQEALAMDNHWRHQYYCTYQDTIRYDFIGSFESYDNDFTYVLERLNASKYYKRESRHQTSSNDALKKYYNESLFERVYNLFKLDFDTFDYSSSPPI